MEVELSNETKHQRTFRYNGTVRNDAPAADNYETMRDLVDLLEVSNVTGNGSLWDANNVGCCIPGSERIIVPVVFALVVALGLVGNILVIAVVVKNRDQYRNTTNIFILNLAIADILFLVFCVPFHAVIYTARNWYFGDFMCKFVHLVQYSSMIASVFTLMCMSLDRFMAVAHPIKTKHIRTPRIALASSIMIWVVSIIWAIPWPIFYTVRVYTQFGPSPLALCADDWGSLKPHRATYYLLLFIFAYAIPLVAIFGFSALMVHQLWADEGPTGTNFTESLRARKKVTRLIIVVVAVFGICWLPSHISWLWANYFKNTWQYNYTFYYLRIFAHVLSYANSSMNPLIYAFLSENFRRGFHKAVQCSVTRIPPSGRTVTGSPRSSEYTRRNTSTLFETST